MKSPWRSLEELPTLSAVTAEWREHTGVAFDGFKAGFLQTAGRTAKSYPCPHKAGCSHKVHPRGNGFVGVSKDDDCDDLRLTAEDVEVWKFDFLRLGRAIAWAFECEPVVENLHMAETIQIGAFSSAAVPVLLTFPQSRDDFQQAITTLVARSSRPFILFGPTNRFLDRRCIELLDKVNAEYFDLASQTTLAADGKLEAVTPAKKLFVRFLSSTDKRADVPVVAASRNAFGKSGSMWEIEFAGSREFHVEDTLGAKYLDYLLHHPNEPISCFDLEVAITPEKAKARDKDSIQKGIDGAAVRKYLRELEQLRADRDEAAEDGDQAKVDRLDDDIEAIGKELKKRGESVDTGERARGNVSKAIIAVRKKLMKRGKDERAFAEHIAEQVSLGYRCSYNSPKGARWQ